MTSPTCASAATGKYMSVLCEEKGIQSISRLFSSLLRNILRYRLCVRVRPLHATLGMYRKQGTFVPRRALVSDPHEVCSTRKMILLAFKLSNSSHMTSML